MGDNSVQFTKKQFEAAVSAMYFKSRWKAAALVLAVGNEVLNILNTMSDADQQSSRTMQYKDQQLPLCKNINLTKLNWRINMRMYTTLPTTNHMLPDWLF